MLKLINNIRMGLATNSSSSHSMVYYRDPIASTDTTGDVDTDFGWDTFRLASTYEKMLYGLTQLINNSWDDQDIDELMREYGHIFPELTRQDFELAAEGYVDHQSTESKTPGEWAAIAKDPHVIIYGGNDNDGDYFDEYLDSEIDLNASYEAPAIRR